jgi:hypothetical protein
MKRLSVAVFVITLWLAGCGQSQNASTSKNATRSDGTTPVKWSSVSLAEQRAIFAVARHYGEENPKVLEVYETKTDSGQQLMYIVNLSGHFKQGNAQSNDLEFSILGNGTEAWAIKSKSGSINDAELILN